MTLLPNITPYGRWQPLGCQWDSRKPQVDRLAHPHYMGFVHRTFSPASDPQNFWVIRQENHWPWPGHCRPVERHPEPRQASYAELSGSSRSTYPHWWPSMGTMLWKPPCWGLLRRNQDSPPFWKSRPPSYAKEMDPQECQVLPPTSGIPQVHRTCWADYHSCYLHCTLQLSFLEGKGVMKRDWHWSQ